jgi:ring-1,2-phenylacetyl-CoA epoxidase subunit PaaC
MTPVQLTRSPAAEHLPLLSEYCLRLGDDRLILGHRTSEWCGHGPMLEEDIALANVALDLIGVGNNFLELAAGYEGKGRSADDLAFQREAIQFRCCHLVEQPNGDYAFTVVRHLFFGVYSVLLFEELAKSPIPEIAGIAGKGLKESQYHIRHMGEWVVRFGNGTPESQKRLQAALSGLWRFTGELFESDQVEQQLHRAGLVPDSSALKAGWTKVIEQLLSDSGLSMPDAATWMVRGARSGRHSEHLGHLLAEMQSVARAHPGASW